MSFRLKKKTLTLSMMAIIWPTNFHHQFSSGIRCEEMLPRRSFPIPRGDVQLVLILFALSVLTLTFLERRESVTFFNKVLYGLDWKSLIDAFLYRYQPRLV